ncbi:hypothetical protein [Arthrobacter sp.]|uniref:hypothetical protein n=1 Tax=Arthrobacter sp. TaxID=1667 RepID=UPI003A922104
MTGLADRAEQIAAYLVGYETGAVVHLHDTDGRQAAVDFLLEWPDGRRGALEVTLVTEKASIAWQGMAMKEGWRWPATSSWEFRAAATSFPYRFVRQAVLRAVELCDTYGVDKPSDLPSVVLDAEVDLARFLADDLGALRRTRLDPGVVIYQSVRAEFVDNAPSDFARVVETWHGEPHMASHLNKLGRTADVSERHLFLVPTDDALPARFFADDFQLPTSTPAGFESVDALWIWSNYWHRYLSFRNGLWAWIDFPPRNQSTEDASRTA